MKAIVYNTKQLQEAIEAGHDPAAIRIGLADVDAVADKARAEGFAAGQAASGRQWQEERARLINASAVGTHPDAMQKIASDERSRILAIQGLAMSGFESLAEKAIRDGVTIEQFAVLQLGEQKDRGITLDAMRRDAPGAAPFAAAPDEQSRGRARSTTDSEAIFKRRSEQAKPDSK